MTDGNKKRVTLWLEQDTIDLLDGAVAEAHRSDLHADEVSRSMIHRHIFHKGVDQWDGSLRAALPDEYIEAYQIKYERERRKKKDYKNKLAGYWRKNVNRQLSKFFDDEEPVRPQRVRITMEHYRDEARDLYENEQWLAEDLQWLDRKLDEYEAATRFVEMVPNESFQRFDSVSVGADLYRLKPQAADVINAIEAIADGSGVDPAAMQKALSNEFAVSEEAIEVLLDYLVPDDVTVRDALSSGEEIREHLPDEVLEEPDLEYNELESKQAHEDKPDSWTNKMDDHSERAQLVIDDPEMLEQAESEINSEVLEARVGGEDDGN